MSHIKEWMTMTKTHDYGYIQKKKPKTQKVALSRYPGKTGPLEVLLREVRGRAGVKLLIHATFFQLLFI